MMVLVMMQKVPADNTAVTMIMSMMMIITRGQSGPILLILQLSANGSVQIRGSKVKRSYIVHLSTMCHLEARKTTQ